MSDFETLLFDDSRDHVEVTLNRSDTKNAIDAQMIDELHRVCAILERTPQIMILTGGADGVFAGGADIAQLRDRNRDDGLAGINVTLFERIRALPLPTVAAIDGYALGGGAELSYACDVRLATPRTVFGQPEPGLGIIAGAGATFRLVRLLGESVAKQVLLAGEWLDADQALRFGLVQSVVDPTELVAAARGVAEKMGRSSQLALRMTKLAVDAGEGAHPQIELAIQAMLFEDDEKIARMTDFLDRRAARSAR
ncbi:enoyl-CoA hydratase/isomerase family protein [Gordonia hydrophobica]|uniref:Enoyl-CoA hydratase/isomerase family protein n=1 Tax=Gordonia hydrophobica TaxID=40516 RepID=A0ABZ2TZ24_9ACTN|nr:enoyl-CoA hydratase/isomerase family protein [Gordonia hydrophobica]MBM7366949.1 enoyl-CoA hydratase/carnithine racemase [Gordonia hydrophobica]